MTAPRMWRLTRLALMLAVSLVIAVVGAAPQARAASMVPVRSVTVAVADIPPGTTFDAAGWATASPQRTPAFALVGLSAPTAFDAEVRTASGDGDWSAWTTVPPLDDGPDPGTIEAQGMDERHHTSPLFTDAADRIQIRTNLASTDGVQAVLVDPFGLDRSLAEEASDAWRSEWSGTSVDPIEPDRGQPAIVTREQWGANESSVRRDPDIAPTVERVFVHHTVGSNSYSRAQSAGIVRGAMDYHVRNLGWDDLGYNFLVDRFGTIYEGRAGGITEPVIGSQAVGFNTGSTGVALMGNYSSATPSPESLAALGELSGWLSAVHHFDPLGTQDVTSFGSDKWRAGRTVTLPNIGVHRDVTYTSCPGDPVIGRMGSVREAARAYAGDLILDQDSDTDELALSRGRPREEAVTVTATLDPPGSWRVDLLGPDGQVESSDGGEGPDVLSRIDLTERTWPPGTYTYVVSSPGRLSAEGTVSFMPAASEDIEVSPTTTTADAEGVLSIPVQVQAELHDEAEWAVLVTASDGTTVFETTGRGNTLDVVWRHGATRAGTYLLGVDVDDAEVFLTPIVVTLDVVSRRGGAADAIGSAVLLSGSTFSGQEANRAVIARHDVYADALAGGPLTAGTGPLLLTHSGQLDDRVAAELDRVLAADGTIYVLGGTAAVSSDVVADLRDRFGDVRRLSGSTRVATAVAVAEVVVAESSSTTAMVARAGPDDAAPWADALAGGAYGASRGIPVLLSDTATLSSETGAAIDSFGITDTLVLGGQAAISDAVLFDLPGATRYAGPDRAATAVAIARGLWGTDIDGVVIVNGFDPDAWGVALAAAPLSARTGSPLVLAAADGLPQPTVDYLASVAPVGGVIAGSTTLVGPTVSAQASALLR